MKALEKVTQGMTTAQLQDWVDNLHSVTWDRRHDFGDEIDPLTTLAHVLEGIIKARKGRN